MIDLHNHLVPGVDDGAASLDESRAALATMRSHGIDGIVTTPHLNGSLTDRRERLEAFFAKLDPAWESLRSMASRDFPDLRLERGVEVMLDTPSPDLSDPRVRLGGTSFVLVEFPFMAIPPRSPLAIAQLRSRGWNPVIAHPERYHGMSRDLDLVDEWRSAGAHLQVNGGSLLGRYGKNAEAIAWRLLREGWVDYLSSDYHARGRCSIQEPLALLAERGGEEQVHLLTEVNPRRLLEDAPPLEVPPLIEPPQPLWRRWFRAHPFR